MYYFLITIFIYIIFLLTCLVLFPIQLILRFVTYPFDRNLHSMHMVSCFWASVLSWLNPLWRVKINGLDKINSYKPQVLISNHQSMADILVLYRLFKHYKWVSKAEIFKFPFVGWNMSLNKYVVVERGKLSGHVRMMNDCENHLKQRSSVMIFPEGTRSATGEMKDFKEGAFRLALTAKVPIIPIVIDGTLNCVPKRGFIMNKRCRIVVNILDPIQYESFAGISSKELSKKAFEIMQKELSEMRK